MAIQHRRGIFDKFDKTRLVPGEYAIVLSGDEFARDGKAVYICFAAGDVKRMATYEDMLDFLVDARDETIAYIETTATADVRKTFDDIIASLNAKDSLWTSHENTRVNNESTRQTNESARQSNETARNLAEEERQATIADFEQKVDDGFFDGATFTPSVDDDGILSWTNDKGLDNPVSKNIKGEKGNDGVITTLAAGMYAFQIDGTNLKLIYGDEAVVPDMEIVDGHLLINIGDDENA